MKEKDLLITLKSMVKRLRGYGNKFWMNWIPISRKHHGNDDREGKELETCGKLL